MAAVQARVSALYGSARMEGEGTEADRAAAAAKAAQDKAAADAAAAKAAEDAKAKAAGGGGGGGGDEPTEAELAALGDTGRRALERIRAQRDEKAAEAAVLAEKAKKYDESVEANKTEQQRKDDAAAAAQKLADEATLELAKIKAALAAGLPHTAAARLVGKDAAELKKDAEAYAKELEENGRPRRRTTSDADKGGDGPSGGMSAVIRRAAGRAG